MRKVIQNYTTANMAWLLLVIFAFSIVYFFSLTFISIDGDHAAALTYHLVERNELLQRPYFFYHGMMDFVVSFIPAQYETLDTVSLTITAIAAVILVITILTLTFEWLKQLKVITDQKWLIALIVLLASPEYFFFGLIYNPSAIAVILVLVAHLIMRKVVTDANKQGGFNAMMVGQGILAAILFGFGSAFRWNIGLYGAIIFVDAVILYMQQKDIEFALSSIRQLISKPIMIYIGWGILALVFTFIAIRISGYDIADIQLQLDNVETSYDGIGIGTAKNLLPFITPAFGLMAGLGFILLVIRRSPLVVIVLLGAVLVAPVFVSGVPKQQLPAIPGATLCAILGFQFIWNELQSISNRSLIRAGLLIILLVPWFVGVSILEEDAQYGPWFEPMVYSRDEIEDEEVIFHLGSGRAYNTPEGYRPLFGYAYVLLADWRPFLLEQNDYYDAIVNEAIERNLPIVITQYPNAYEINRLLGLGYTTDDYEYRAFSLDDNFVERRFTNDEGQTVTVLYYELLTDSTPEELESITTILPLYDEVIWRGYMHTVRHAYNLVPDALTEITPNAVVLDLQSLTDALKE